MDNIILFGMPGCGKSTVGVVLAKILGYNFIDSDLLIQNKYGKLLRDIIKDEGREGFRKIEEDVNFSIRSSHTVIATGGSVVYCHKAMAHFKTEGKIIYIKLTAESIAERLGDITGRGISMKDGQTINELYAERIPYYEKYADIIFNAEGLGIRDAAFGIRESLNIRRISDNGTRR
jgi:shikimate kinase